jgi:hypothetical protein
MLNLTNNTDFIKRTSSLKFQKLARFQTVRHLYSQTQKILQNLSSVKLPEHQNEVFAIPIDQKECQKQLTSKSIYTLGNNLHPDIIDEIYQLAIANPCIEPKQDYIFYAKDVNNQKKSNYIYRGLVTDIHNCPTIQKVTHNSQLIEIATSFLGYIPTQITQHLTWSFVVPENEAQIQKSYPPTNWHYDVAGMNFVTASFYITDVLDIESGAHILIPGSHKNKPIAMLLNSNIQKEETVFKYYSREEQIFLTGKAGFGFIEDPSCLHRVKPPTKQNRLILQIRYS